MINIKSIMWKYVEKTSSTILSILFKLVGKELKDDFYHTFMQFVRFGIVGVSNTAISYVLYILSLTILKKFEFIQNIDYVIAQIIAFLLSVLWSFYWNNKMVFVVPKDKKRNIGKTLLKTYISYSFTGLFLNSILLILWVQVCGISEYIAPIINLLVSVPLNFVINKFWAFK